MKLSPRGRVAALLVAFAASTIGCDDKGDPSGPEPTPAITLAVGSTTIQLVQGGTANVPVTITRAGGFNGAVSVAAEGLPAGVTAPALTITSGQTQGLLVLTADGAATPGTGTVTLRATGAGVTAQTATFPLALAVRGTFNFTAVPALSIAQGANGNAALTVTRNGGFTGNVALTATAPAGLTATITPASLTGTATAASLNVAATAVLAPGVYPVVVTAQTPGLPAQTATVNVTVTVAGTYTLALTPSTLSLVQGTAGNATLAVNRVGGFNGAVAITATAPAGITATVTPASVTGNTAAVAVSVAASVAPGTHSVTLRGVTPGLADQTVALAVTVTTPGSFSLALAPTTLPLVQGTSGTSTVTVTRVGAFTGSVNLTATAPAGLTASLAPTEASGATSVLTVAASAAMAPGTYQVSVRGTGANVAEQTATLNVTVSQAGSIALSAVPAALTIQSGSAGEVAINIARTAFTGAVNLAVTTPAGIVPSSPALVATGNSVTLGLGVVVGTAPGNYNVTVRGTGAGIADQTLTIPVTVTQAGSIALSLTPSSLTLQQGGSGSAAVGIARTAFTGNVQLSATAPAGITATFSEATVAGTASTLNIAVAASVAPGAHTVTVRGTGTGIAEQTTALTVNVTQAGSFALTLTPPSLTLQQGASGSTTVGITRTAFTGNVAFTATAPAGITTSFTSADVAGASTTLNVNVGAAVAPGTYTVNVNGTGTGVAAQTAALSVVVTAGGTFNLALGTGVIAVVPGGGAGSVPLTLTRTNYTAAINLTATGQPPGVTVSFTPATVTGTTSTINVTAAGSVAAGSYPVTIRANGTGAAEQTAQLLVTVQAVGPGNVAWTFCGASGIPAFVAAQDGDGPWAQVPLSAGVYRFQINSGRGGVTYVVPGDGGGWDNYVFYGTTAELQAQGEALCSGTTGGKTITGTSTGLNGEFGWITLGSRQVVAPGVAGPFTLTNVPDGPVDLITARAPASGTGFGAPSRFSIQRNLNPANNGSLGTVDLSSGFAPAASTVTFTNLAGGEWTTSLASYLTPRNTSAFLFTEVGLFGPAGVRNWYGFPSAQRQAGELHVLEAIATDPAALTGSFNYYTRQVRFVTAEVGPRSATLGPVPAVPTITTVATAPYVRFRVNHTVNASYNRYFVAFFNQGTEGQTRDVQIQKTDAYVSAGGPLPMEIPDLSGVAGWNNTWGMRTGLETFWGLTASGWSGSGIMNPVLVDGAIILSGTRNGRITP